MVGRLSLIGMGLHDEKDLTLRGMEAAKKSDLVFVEFYTSKWYGNMKNFQKLVGKKVRILKRKDLEENSKKIIELAEKKDVAIFVQGDALIQTTHMALINEAMEKSIETRVIHGASIISAIGETGLHPQKFGPYVTIPYLEKTKNQLPESVYDVIKANKERGLHTLCLLDVIADEKRYMSPNEGMDILLQVEGMRKENVFTEESDVIVFARAGSDRSLLVYGKVSEMMEKDFGKPPAVFIIPGNLHFTEREHIERFRE
jgi:diphthine synthase